MSEEIKCEAVFPDKDEAFVLAIKKPNGEIYEDLVSFPFFVDKRELVVGIYKERKTPVWTKADQQAGRLPEVGSLVMFGKSVIEFLGVGENSNYWACRYPTGVISLREASIIKPIETPEERAKREEDEVVKSLLCEHVPDASLEWRCLFERGVRATYRKLKMPEVQK